MNAGENQMEADNRQFDGKLFLKDVNRKLNDRLAEIQKDLNQGLKEIENMHEYYWENYTEMDRLSFRPPILQTRSPGSETFPLPQTECLSLLCVVSSYKTSSIFRSFTALHLSFVGSFKCYTFVKFVTFTLYQLAICLSTSLTDFSLTSLDSKFLYYSFFFFFPFVSLIIL